MRMPLSLSARVERWPIAGAFSISRGAKIEAVVVVAEVSDGRHRGRGECVPYARYDETASSVMAALGAMGDRLALGLDRAGLQQAMPAGAARNALDCALWDLEAKRAGRPAHELAGLAETSPLTTAYTISLAAPGSDGGRSRPRRRAAAPQGQARRALAIRSASAPCASAAPQSELIADANEGWTAGNLAENLAACAEAGVTLIEQPLPANDDAALAAVARPIPVCADESAHDRASLAGLAGRYDAVNIKLDKTGGLTEALAMAAEAERLGFGVMVGCMVATSLAMAPAMLLAQRARVVDLDGPLLLARDRPDGLRYENSLVHPPTQALWG